MSWLHRYVDFWSEKEHPISMALVRISVGVCWVYDLSHLWRLGLVKPLFAVQEVGGLSDAIARAEPPWFYLLMPGTELSGVALHLIMSLAALSFTLGFFTRSSAAVLWLAWCQWAQIMPGADRGIDQLSRHVLFLMMFSPAGEAWSVDALWRTGSFWGEDTKFSAVTRRLLIGQLVLMYTTAGLYKTGVTWWPMGQYHALFYALQDPGVAAFDFFWTRDQPYLFFTQLGSFSTMLYQLTYPLVLVLMWWHRHPDTGWQLWGLRKFAVRYRVEYAWIIAGTVFHIVLAAAMNLGIFPYAMMALYPVWVRPHEWRQLWGRLARERAPSAV